MHENPTWTTRAAPVGIEISALGSCSLLPGSNDLWVQRPTRVAPSQRNGRPTPIVSARGRPAPIRKENRRRAGVCGHLTLKSEPEVGLDWALPDEHTPDQDEKASHGVWTSDIPLAHFGALTQNSISSPVSPASAGRGSGRTKSRWTSTSNHVSTTPSPPENVTGSIGCLGNG